VKAYEGANLRNLALIGHGHAGKTTLVSAMLYTAGAAPRLGRVDDGTAITDYDEDCPQDVDCDRDRFCRVGQAGCQGQD
jgi:translation elongation factor EF-G